MVRVMVTIMAALALGAVSMFAGEPGTASAGEWWCWDDPVLVVNGRVLHIYAGVPQIARMRVTGAEVTITVPEGVDARLTASTSPYFPETARLVRQGSVGPDGSITVSVTVVVSGHGLFPAALKIVQPSGEQQIIYGQSNRPITGSFTLRAAPTTNTLRNVR